MRKHSCIPVILLAWTAAFAMAQEAATVSAPNIAKAGETVDLVITLDKAPNFEGSGLSVTVSGPGTTISSGCEVKRGNRVCHYPFHLPDAAPGGTWYVSNITFFTGAESIALKLDKVSFLVIAKPDLVFPTSAQVSVNPSQLQLLRRETARLQKEIQALKASVADSQGNGTLSDNLRLRAQAEVAAIEETESTFQNLASQKSGVGAAKVFFGDLIVSYKEVLRILPSSQKADLTTTVTILPIALSSARLTGTDQGGGTYPLVAQAVFRVFEQNELAYQLVAATAALTFDLEVASVPEGASVSYRRRGDAYQTEPNPTNSVLKDLPYAIWIVHFQKSGFREKEIEHDPFRESNHSVTVELSKK